jgi:hypothetical protein
MNLNDLHRRLLRDVLEIGNALPLVITGGYAVQAHHIVDRFSRDIDMATDSTVTMEAIVATWAGTCFGRRYRHQGSSLGGQRATARSHRYPRRIAASDHD